VIAYIEEGGVHRGGVDGVMGGRGEVMELLWERRSDGVKEAEIHGEEMNGAIS